MLLVVRPQRTEMKKLQQMLANLKKNDRVVTSGGIHGVVVQANSGDSTVVLRIDENSGARITINRESIAKVLTEHGSDGA
jgi:preprotein translocase subunit YajC